MRNGEKRSADSPARALREAEAWLVSAKQTLVEAQDDDARAGVCCAQAIHGIIRANDALTLKFFGTKAARHDDAIAAFAKLVREGKLEKADESFKSLVAKAVRDKSGADYGKKTFSYDKARAYADNAEWFIGRVKNYVD